MAIGSPAGARYLTLAKALALLALFYPLLGYGLMGLGVWTTAFWLVLLGVLRTSSSVTKLSRIERCLGLLACLGSLSLVALHAVEPGGHRWFFALFDSLALVFLAVATARILGDVLFDDHTDRDRLVGAGCAYVLLGLVFAYALLVLQGLTGSEQVFVAPENRIEVGDPLGLIRARLLYASFVTLTTLGYGDMTATTLEARMVLGVEAVVGQLYLAILVARLIGLHTSRKRV